MPSLWFSLFVHLWHVFSGCFRNKASLKEPMGQSISVLHFPGKRPTRSQNHIKDSETPTIVVCSCQTSCSFCSTELFWQASYKQAANRPLLPNACHEMQAKGSKLQIEVGLSSVHHGCGPFLLHQHVSVFDEWCRWVWMAKQIAWAAKLKVSWIRKAMRLDTINPASPDRLPGSLLVSGGFQGRFGQMSSGCFGEELWKEEDCWLTFLWDDSWLRIRKGCMKSTVGKRQNRPKPVFPKGFIFDLRPVHS